MSDSSVFLGVIFSGTRRSDVMVRLLPHSDTNQPDLLCKQRPGLLRCVSREPAFAAQL
jgi:hypothetical protein